MLTALSKASIPINGDLRGAASASHWSPGLQSIVAARRTRSIVTFATPEKGRCSIVCISVQPTILSNQISSWVLTYITNRELKIQELKIDQIQPKKKRFALKTKEQHKCTREDRVPMKLADPIWSGLSFLHEALPILRTNARRVTNPRWQGISIFIVVKPSAPHHASHSAYTSEVATIPHAGWRMEWTDTHWPLLPSPPLWPPAGARRCCRPESVPINGSERHIHLRAHRHPSQYQNIPTRWRRRMKVASGVSSLTLASPSPLWIPDAKKTEKEWGERKWK